MSIPSRSSTLFSDYSPKPPTISQLYDDAAEFDRVLAHSDQIVPTRESDSYSKFIGHDLAESETSTSISKHLYNEPETFLHNNLPAVSEGIEGHSEEKTISRVSQGEDASEGKSWQLDSETIVELMIEEFGSLTVDGESETLLMDTEGCLMAGVMVVGALHLTTHRLAFHASLCKCRQGLASPRQVLKSGRAILHQGKWRPRRRVWLELATDMLCVYSSSGHDATMPPLRSILFGFFEEILPTDPEFPTYLKLVLCGASRRTSLLFEFETIVSTQDWGRELRGAIFLSRHQRRNRLDDIGPQDSVRFSCPLNRIDLTSSSPFLGVLTRIALHLSFTHSDITDESSRLLGAQILQIGVLKNVPLASELAYMIVAAKHRPTVDRPIFLDLGPFSFTEQEVRSTVTCSNLGARGSPLSRAQEHKSRLWFCPARLLSSTRSSGYLVMTPTHMGLWSKDLTRCNPQNYRLLSSIESVEPFRTAFCHVNGMTIQFNGHDKSEFMRLAFNCPELRDEAMYRIREFLPLARAAMSGNSPSRAQLSFSGRPNMTRVIAPLSRSLATAVKANLPLDVKLHLPKAINIPSEIIGRRPPRHFVCLTIGSRGDIQPYIALGLGLKKKGHWVTIVTHEEYKGWIENFGLQHRSAGGDPGELMKLSVENKMFSPEFFKKVVIHFRSWLDELLADAWRSCRDAEVLLESPSAMAGVHIAEALNIPYFRTFTMPWTKTSDFPHPFFSPPGGSPVFNSASYILFNNVLWRATSEQINSWRRSMLSLGEIDMGHQAQSRLTYIYDFSQVVVPKPLDWGDNITISGYWFLDNAEGNWIPPIDFLQWIEQARSDGKPIVYIGFGSITIPRPNRVMSQILKAVIQSDVRAILSKGWSTRMNDGEDHDEIAMLPHCYVLEKVPHDWLFPRIDAAMHHGGAGTTGASLRAGIPTLIKPWFGDQFFWASRLEKLGAGVKLNSFKVQEISNALVRITTDRAMKEKAAQVGMKIRAEDGVHTAIYTIYTQMDKYLSRN